MMFTIIIRIRVLVFKPFQVLHVVFTKDFEIFSMFSKLYILESYISLEFLVNFHVPAQDKTKILVDFKVSCYSRSNISGFLQKLCTSSIISQNFLFPKKVLANFPHPYPIWMQYKSLYITGCFLRDKFIVWHVYSMLVSNGGARDCRLVIFTEVSAHCVNIISVGSY